MTPAKVHELNELVLDYRKRLRSAEDFAAGAEGEVWNGLFLMGLELAGLCLIPYNTGITSMTYWKTAPEPKGGAQDWPISWIVPRDAFSRLEV